MRTVKWLSIIIFLGAVVTTLTVRNTGYIGASTAEGRYYAQYRSSKVEVSRDDFVQIVHRNRVSGWAVVVMFISAGAFIAIERLPHYGGR